MGMSNMPFAEDTIYLS